VALALWSAAASALPSYFPSVLITWPLGSVAAAQRQLRQSPIFDEPAKGRIGRSDVGRFFGESGCLGL